MIAINQTFPPGAYIFHKQTLFPYLRDTTQSVSPLSLLSSCSLFIPVSSLCAHRDRENRPPEPDALHRDTCSDVAGNQVFGERLPRLLAGEFVVFFLVDVRRIEIDCCVFVFFLVDIRGTALRTSSCIDCGPLLHATHYVN